MRKMLLGFLLVLSLVVARPASAQAPYGPYGPGAVRPGFGMAPNPAVSPYLNILRGGAPAGVNYYDIVQPQIQFQNSISQLQQQTYQIQGGGGAVAGGMPATGHAVFFDNKLHYYGMRPGATGTQGFAGAPTTFQGGMGRGPTGARLGAPGTAPGTGAGTSSGRTR